MEKIFNLILLFLLSLLQNAYAQSLEGKWNGELEIPGTKLDLIIEIKSVSDSYSATLSIPSQGANGLAFDKVEFNAETKELNVEITSVQLAYKGKLSDNQLIGTFHQGGYELPLNLQKAIDDNPSTSKYNRPQTPLPPFDYHSEDVSFVNKMDNITITGTLTLPKNHSNKTPIVILFNGSGQQDRDCTIFYHKPFLVIADFLTKKGYGVLRYDDRGIGGTTRGDLNKATTFDFAKDGQAAIDFLTSKGYKNIHILGHSEGGLIASILGAQNPKLKSVILLASPSVSGDIILAEQVYYGNIAMGIHEQVASFNRSFMYMVANEIIGNPSMDEKTLETKIIQYLDNTDIGKMMSESDKQSLAEKTAKENLKPWIVTFMKLDPKEYLVKVKSPIFAIYGGSDVQVPSIVNEEKMKSIISFSKKNEVKVIPNINHLLQYSLLGDAKEYIDIEETINEEILNSILDWLNKNK